MVWDQAVMKRLKSVIKQSIFRSCAMAQLLAHVTVNNSKNARLIHQIFCNLITCMHTIKHSAHLPILEMGHCVCWTVMEMATQTEL